MSARRLSEVIDDIDLDSRYNLRRTEQRVTRLRTWLSDPSIDLATMPGSPVPPVATPAPSTSQSPQSNQQQLYNMMAQTARSLPVSRFAGNVPEDVPNRIQLMSYDVTRWLCDAETRCSVKGITDDVLKIKEAKLAPRQLAIYNEKVKVGFGYL